VSWLDISQQTQGIWRAVIEDKNEALILAKNLIADLVTEIGKDKVEEARNIGMATSIYAEQIAETKRKFLSHLSPKLKTSTEIFEVEVSRQFM
jgi:hypothetical protein